MYGDSFTLLAGILILAIVLFLMISIAVCVCCIISTIDEHEIVRYEQSVKIQRKEDSL